MTNLQILEKAIQKAIDGGWKAQTDKAQDIIDWFSGDFKGRMFEECIIFNHEFAKALWGNKPLKQHFGMSCSVTRPAYAHHLQQMVIAEDPIKYLADNT